MPSFNTHNNSVLHIIMLFLFVTIIFRSYIVLYTLYPLILEKYLDSPNQNLYISLFLSFPFALF